MSTVAKCGTCGHELPMMKDGLAYDFGHFCRKQLPAAGIQVVINQTPNGWTVSIGDRYHDQLTWGEMLEVVISQTHPDIPKTRGYPLLTLSQWKQRYPYMFSKDEQ